MHHDGTLCLKMQFGGFAFRDIAENFLASLLLSVRNPFRSGDLVEVAGHMGIVQNLNTRSTILLTLDGSHVQIPNATVYKSTIENFSSNPNRRANFAVGSSHPGATPPADSHSTTEGEGNLASDARVISQQASSIAPEGKENLLNG